MNQVPSRKNLATLPVPHLEHVRRLHMVGVGGAGMSAIARLSSKARQRAATSRSRSVSTYGTAASCSCSQSTISNTACWRVVSGR